jgi:hypothetical protein
MRVGGTISASAWSTAAESIKISNWRPIATEAPLMGAIPKQSAAIAGSIVIHTTPCLTEQEIIPEQPFDPALSAFAELKAAASVGWADDLRGSQTRDCEPGAKSKRGMEMDGENAVAE